VKRTNERRASRASQIAQARASPSAGAVPRPSSSTTTRLRASALSRMQAHSRISRRKLLQLDSSASPVPRCVNMLSKTRSVAKVAGTKQPAREMNVDHKPLQSSQTNLAEDG